VRRTVVFDIFDVRKSLFSLADISNSIF